MKPRVAAGIRRHSTVGSGPNPAALALGLDTFAAWVTDLFEDFSYTNMTN